MTNGQQRPFDGAFKVTITPKGMRARSSGGLGMFQQVLLALQKTYYLVRLELHQTSFGLHLGNFWLLLEPALQALAYYFLLSVVFRIGGADSTFAFFFVGITFWRSHATMVTGAPYFLTTKGHYYVEHGLGLNIALMELVANEALLLLIRLTVLCAFLVMVGYAPLMTWPLILVVAAVQFTFSMAIHIWLSMFGVLLKDSAKFVGHFVWLWWYLSPGLYSIHRIPPWAEFFYYLNPFAYLMPAYHHLLLLSPNSTVAILPIFWVFLGSFLVLWLGLVKLRGFSYSMMQHI